MNDIVTLKNKKTGEIIKLRKKQQPQEQFQPTIQQSTGQIKDFKEHPLKTLLRVTMQPVSQSVAGTTIGQQYNEKLGTIPFQIAGNNPIAQKIAFGQSYMGGLGADVADIAQTPMTYLGGQMIRGGAKILKPLIKWDTALTQAKNAKTALDTIRKTLGKAKEIALNDVRKLQTSSSIFKNIKSNKIINELKEPFNDIAFNRDGTVVNTVGNFDKIKVALRNLLTRKDIIDATGDTEKIYIKRFAGEIRKEILKATKKAGKPELGKALDDYSDFMDNYSIINDHLVNKYGNAMANKLKASFRPQAEEALKESWKEMSVLSPEVKGIIKSRENRELMKRLLKYSAYTALGTGAVGGVISGVKSSVQ